MTRYGHAGAARKAALTVALGDGAGDLVITCDNLAGWPTGSDGLRPFWAAIDRGTMSEEKILVASRSGNVLTVQASGRGTDDTVRQSHEIGAVIEHVFTAAEADQANAHGEATHDVHGATGDIVGTTGAQTLSNKTLNAPVVVGGELQDVEASGTFVAEQIQSGNIHDSTVVNSQITSASKVTLAGDQTLEEFRTREVIITNVAPDGGDSGDVAIRYTPGVRGLWAKVSGVWTAVITEMFGLPAGGTTGQYLKKKTGADGDAEWGDLPPNLGGGVPVGGVTNQIMRKNSAIDRDITWADITELLDFLSGGSIGQVLAKASGDDFDFEWTDAVGGGGGGPTDIVATAPYPTGGDTIGTYVDGPFTYRYHVFSTTGSIASLVVTNGVIGTLLVAAGGGCGMYQGGIGNAGGGGGAGGLIYTPYAFGAGTHNCQTGAGGRADPYNEDGEDSWFDDLTATGGGKGGSGSAAGNAGGSGGGAWSGGSNPGSGVSGQGTAGGNGSGGGTAGGGGGAVSAGTSSTGGSGNAITMTGTEVEYSHGGYPGKYLDPAVSTIHGPGQGGRGGGHFSNVADPGQDGVIIVRYRIV